MTATLEPTTAPALDSPAPAPSGDTTAIVDSADLLRAVKTVKGAVANKTTLPVLNNVLLHSPEPGALDVTATNLEVGITVHLPALVFEPFALTVPHKLFMDTLPKNGDVILTIRERTCTLNMEEPDGAQTNYKGIASEEYPIIPPRTEDWPLAAVLPNALVQRAVKEVVPYASQDDNRPQLAAVCVTLSDDGSVMFAAADGFRLGRLTGQTVEDSPAPVAGQYLVPASAFAQLAVLADQGEAVQVWLTPGRNQIVFEAGRVEVTSRLIEGNYVDINRVIPQDWATRVVADVDTLAAAVKKIAPFTKDGANIMRVSVDENGRFTLSGNAAEVGDRTVPVPTLDIQGEGGQVALNLRFVADLLAPYKGQTVSVELKTYQSPATFRVGDDFLAVIMPMYLPSR
jgi:DNA polymerase-3 subunit beta